MFKTTKLTLHIPEKFKCHSLYHCQLYKFFPTIISLDLCKCCKSAQLSNVQIDWKDCKNSCISIGFRLTQWSLSCLWLKIWRLGFFIFSLFFFLHPSNCFSSAYTSDPEKCPWVGNINLFQPSVTTHKTNMEWEGKGGWGEEGAKR